LHAVQSKRRKENTIRYLFQSFLLAAYAYESLYIIIPRRYIFIPYRPIDGYAFFGVRLKVDVTPPVAMSAPHDRAATYMMAPYPVKPLHFIIRIFIILIDPMFVVLVHPPV